LTEGIDKHEFNFQSIGTYKITLALFSHGLDNLQTLSGIANGSFDVGTGTASTSKIPSWIKNNAGWWKEGSIDDNSFVQGIQYLIKEGIMKIG
jgi:hypothetical protein